MVGMTGDEFGMKILRGERDFSGIYLVNTSLTGKRSEVVSEHLKEYSSEKNPLILTSADLQNFRAEDLDIPFIIGKNAKLKNCRFTNCCFNKGDFSEVVLSDSEFYSVNFEGTNFQKAYIRGSRFLLSNLNFANFQGAYIDESCFLNSNFRYVNLQGARFNHNYYFSVDLSFADIRGVLGLEKIPHLEQVLLYKTKVTEREKAIIEGVMKDKRFSVMEE